MRLAVIGTGYVQAAEGADAVDLVTEWRELTALGFRYYGIGRR